MGTIADLCEGLHLLLSHYERVNGYHVDAEYCTICAQATDTPLVQIEVERMISLGWFQDNYGENADYLAKHYDPKKSWCFFT